MKKINSIFTAHYNRLMQINDEAQLEQEVFSIINDSNINPFDRKKVLRDIASISNDITKMQFYLTNSMLKYQGLGTLK